MGGDPHLAEEVTQSVFLDLARKARGLVRRDSLTGWLYTSTRFAAIKALRTRARRLHRETKAHVMDEINATPARTDIAWAELRPVIDEAMHELNEDDREALLQRYFEERALAEVGRTLGLSENTARMRVDRALDKLRARLAERGITSTAGALAAVLASQPVIAAPAGLAAATASASLAGAATGSAAAAFFYTTLMNTTFSKAGAGAAALLLCAAGLGVYQMNRARADAQHAAAALSAKVSEQTRALAGLLAENNRLKTATSAGPTTGAARAAAAGDRLNADEIGQQVSSAFRAPNLTDMFMQLATVLQHVSPKNWRGAMQAFKEARQRGEDPGPVWELFVRRAGETVGKDAVQQFVESNDLASARLALSGWASAHPIEALGWISKEASAETRTSIMGAAIRGLALTEPDLAVQAIEDIPIERRKEYVWDFAAQLVRGAGLDQAGTLVEGMIRRAAANGQGGDDYLKRIFGEYAEIKARRIAASGDLEELAGWVKTHANQPYTDSSLLWNTAAQIAQTSVPRALAWLDTLHAAGPVGEPDNPRGYGAVLVTWANKEGPSAVAAWLEANTQHPRYDYIVAQYAPALAGSNADEAKKLAATIRNAAIRDTALKKIAERGVKPPGN